MDVLSCSLLEFQRQKCLDFEMDLRRPYPTQRNGGNSYSSQPSSRYSPSTFRSRFGSNEIRGTDIIAEYLVKERVPYLLGYCGHGAIGLLDGIHAHSDRIKHIAPRIEQGAGFMADAYYRLTGRPLAIYASTGPGPLNMTISVANAFYDHSAFCLFTGQVPTNQVNSGALQDDYRYNGDMSSFFEPITKKSYRIREVADLCTALPEAFQLMRTGRPGPVHFDMPYNLYIETAPVSTPEPHSEQNAYDSWQRTASEFDIKRALELLCSCDRPLILAGGAIRVSGAFTELKALAEQLGVPVYTSFMGKGALPYKHELHLGVGGVWGEYPATEACRNADVILAVGA